MLISWLQESHLHATTLQECGFPATPRQPYLRAALPDPRCGAAVAGVTARGLTPAAFELIDRHCLRAVNEWKNAGLPDDAAALLLAQSDLPEPAAEAEAEGILAAFEAARARDAVMSTDPVEAEALFEARRLAYPALEQRGEALLT